MDSPWASSAEPSAALLAFCRRLPKVELHAHLNGSLRESTLLELASERGIDPDALKLARKGAPGRPAPCLLRACRFRQGRARGLYAPRQ